MPPTPIPVLFYRTKRGNEPVREWLKDLGRPGSSIIGDFIGTVQTDWPVGMPICRPMGDGLHEVRCSLHDGRIARVLFCFHSVKIVLLHGFIKKTQQTPDADLSLARKRQAECVVEKEDIS